MNQPAVGPGPPLTNVAATPAKQAAPSYQAFTSPPPTARPSVPVAAPQQSPQQSTVNAARSTLAGVGAHIATSSSSSGAPPGQADDPNIIFERLRVLRTTLFGQLWLAKFKATGQLCAIKRSEKERMASTRSREDPRAECRMLRIVRGHRNVVNLLGEYECAKYHWIVYELVEGGDFFGLVERGGKLDDRSARIYFKQMVQGVLFMHKAGLAHLDLKPENLLITKDHTDIKICDFGMARELKEARPLASAPTSPIRYFQGPVGTKLYMAPEVFAGRPFVPPLADSYSLGVVLYVMLTGAPPYELPAESDLRFQYIFNGRIVDLLKHFKYFDSMQPEAVDLLGKILCTYLNRLSLEQILQHPWLQDVDVDEKKRQLLLSSNQLPIGPSSVVTPGGIVLMNTSAAAAAAAAGVTPPPGTISSTPSSMFTAGSGNGRR